MKTRLRKSEKMVVMFELAIIAVFVVMFVISIKCIIDGSLLAVVVSTLPAIVIGRTVEDVMRIIGEARRREGHA